MLSVVKAPRENMKNSPAVWNSCRKKRTDSTKLKMSRQVEPIDLIADVARSLCYLF